MMELETRTVLMWLAGIFIVTTIVVAEWPRSDDDTESPSGLIGMNIKASISRRRG